MKPLIGHLALVLIWPGAVFLLGVISHIVLGAEYYGYAFAFAELVLPLGFLVIGYTLRHLAHRDGLERTAGAVAFMAKIGFGFGFIIATITSIASGFEGQGHWIMVLIYLVIAGVASRVRVIAWLNNDDPDHKSPTSASSADVAPLKPPRVPREFLKTHLCTWDGEKFVNENGAPAISRTQQGKQLDYMRKRTDPGQSHPATSEHERHALDHWANLDSLLPGDEIWSYTRPPWAGRALVRGGDAIDHTEETHIKILQLPA